MENFQQTHYRFDTDFYCSMLNQGQKIINCKYCVADPI